MEGLKVKTLYSHDDGDSPLNETVSQKALEIVSVWQLEPRKEVNESAERIVSLSCLPVGQIAVELGVISKGRLDQYLSSYERRGEQFDEDDSQFLTYLAKEVEDVRERKNEILSIKNGHLFLQTDFVLGEMEQWEMPDSFDSEERMRFDARCQEKTAVVVDYQGDPLIVFGDYERFQAWLHMGTATAEECALCTALETRPREARYAFAPTSAVSEFLSRSVQSHSECAGISNQTPVKTSWFAQQGTSVGKKLTALFEYALDQEATDIFLQLEGDGTAFVKTMARRRTRPYSQWARVGREDFEFVCNILLGDQVSNANKQAGAIDRPLDGSFFLEGRDEVIVPVRLNCVPSGYPDVTDKVGSIAMRLRRDDDSRQITLEDCGLPDEFTNDLRYALTRGEGLVLVNGPTGSGKSTTIAGGITEYQEIHEHRVNVVSVEDPIEKNLPGVVQVNLDTNQLSYMQAFKALMRQTPNLIYLGELRDKDAAGAAVDGGISGHLVLSTTHAGTPSQCIFRVKNLLEGSKLQEFISCLNMICSQRLYAPLCTACRVEKVPSDKEKNLYRSAVEMAGIKGSQAELPQKVFTEGQKHDCSKCRGSGRQRERPLVSWILFSEASRVELYRRVASGEGISDYMSEIEKGDIVSEARRLLAAGEQSVQDILKFFK